MIRSRYEMKCDIAYFFELFCMLQNKLDHSDYVKIWGEHLGNHIWRQEGSNILKIWTSGLSKEEKQKFVAYILEKQLEWQEELMIRKIRWEK